MNHRIFKHKWHLIIPLFLYILLYCIQLHAMSAKKSSENYDLTLNQEYTDKSSLVISGKIIKKDEIWDRRGNREMGRPDILTEIFLYVKVASVQKGKLPKKGKQISISIKGHKSLISFRMLKKGDCGIFYLKEKEKPFTLFRFELISSEPIKPPKQESAKQDPRLKPEKYGPPYTDEKVDEMLEPPVRITHKMIQESEELKLKIIKKIAAKFGMKNADILAMTSFQGPRPPEGGYRYWGVKGTINGIWHVWQPGRNNKLIKGDKLYNPKRHQKCNSPFTMILTPGGPMPIKNIKPGEMVLDEDKNAVPVLEISRVKAENHMIYRVVLDSGAILEISPGHPIAGGRMIGDLKNGDRIDGKLVISAEIIPYQYEYTYDILPDSPSGIYWANGVRIVSTLLINDQ